MPSLIELKHVTKTYIRGGHILYALNDVNLSVDTSELISIMGESGAGKSTAMNILGLLDKPTSGTYFLHEIQTENLSPNDQAFIRNKEIGFVFQSFFLLPRFSALKNIALPLLYRGIHRKEAEKKALEIMEKINIQMLKDSMPKEMSGGQQQRVAIARALVGNPSVILADEPTGALDSETSASIMQLFHELQKEHGQTIIIVTHDPAIGAQCQRIIMMKDGKIIKDHLNEKPGLEKTQQIATLLANTLHNPKSNEDSFNL